MKLKNLFMKDMVVFWCFGVGVGGDGGGDGDNGFVVC